MSPFDPLLMFCDCMVGSVICGCGMMIEGCGEMIDGLRTSGCGVCGCGICVSLGCLKISDSTLSVEIGEAGIRGLFNDVVGCGSVDVLRVPSFPLIRCSCSSWSRLQYRASSISAAMRSGRYASSTSLLSSA